MSSVLDMMKQVKQERLEPEHPQQNENVSVHPVPVHPLEGEDISVRFPYMVGVTIIALADGELMAEKRALLEYLFLSMGFLEEQRLRILDNATVVKPDTIVTIVESLNNKEHQYAFILDLYNLGWRDGQIGMEAGKMTNVFADLLKLSMPEQEFLLNFAIGSLIGEVEKSYAAIDVASINGLVLPDSVLREFLLRLDYQDKDLLKGKRLKLLGDCYYCGNGVAQNLEEAVKWYRKAAEQGNASAKDSLDACYLRRMNYLNWRQMLSRSRTI